MNEKTEVYVVFNGIGRIYVFNENIKSFQKAWTEQVSEIGFYQGHTESGELVTISPLNCGLVEIKELELIEY